MDDVYSQDPNDRDDIYKIKRSLSQDRIELMGVKPKRELEPLQDILTKTYEDHNPSQKFKALIKGERKYTSNHDKADLGQSPRIEAVRARGASQSPLKLESRSNQPLKLELSPTRMERPSMQH
mgnify:FL=1